MWAVVTTAPPQIEDVLALSPLQEGLFALYRLSDDDIDLYTMQFVVDIHGPLGVALLRRSASAMLDRYPNLRAAFWDRDVPKPVQIVPVTAELPWAQRVAAPAEFESIARSERGRPFDLGRGPAMRVLLLAVPGENRHRMILTVHHILMDGWALAVFFTEMLAVYRAGGSLEALPAPRPYRDYIVWLAEQDNSAAMARWNDYLCGASGPLMVADGAAGARGGVPGKTQLLLGPADTVRLRLWAAGHGLTLGTAVLFAWTVVLGRLTDREDVVFGTIVSGRPERLTGVESMVGLFINAVPVVHHLGSGASVVAQCARLQRELSAMRDIGHLSLSAIQREHGRGTLFDTLFVFENAPIEDAIRPAQAPDGTRFCPIEMESLTHYPLAVVSHLQDDALVVMVEAVGEALPYLRAADIGERLLAVLRQLPDAGDGTPDVFDVLTPAERAEFYEPAAHARIPDDGTTVWEVFERQVRATPDAVALTGSGADHFTYAELHAAAGRIAGELVEHGIGPESVVALVLPRSTGAVVAIWAVLAAGGAYVPVDVALPEARIESILRQANPALVITDTSRSELVGDGRPKLVLDDPAVAQRCSRRAVGTPAIRRHPEHCAYIIFTSGSSGEPKGVVATNAALLAYFADHRERVYRAAAPHLGRPLRIAHAWSLSFDASWQPMVGLLDGHELHLFDAEEMRDADLLVEGMARSGVDMIDTTPSMLTQLCAAGLLDRDLAVLALGGEPIDSVLWAELRSLPRTAVYNCYGPTETTVEAVVAAVREHPVPTIGTTNTGTTGYVLDSRLRAVPSGVVGELYLSGAQLARGYLRRPDLTAGRFVADPLCPGSRMYRTGDLVRRLPDGGYAYSGARRHPGESPRLSRRDRRDRGRTAGAARGPWRRGPESAPRARCDPGRFCRDRGGRRAAGAKHGSPGGRRPAGAARRTRPSSAVLHDSCADRGTACVPVERQRQAGRTRPGQACRESAGRSGARWVCGVGAHRYRAIAVRGSGRAIQRCGTACRRRLLRARHGQHRRDLAGPQGPTARHRGESANGGDRADHPSAGGGDRLHCRLGGGRASPVRNRMRRGAAAADGVLAQRVRQLSPLHAHRFPAPARRHRPRSDRIATAVVARRTRRAAIGVGRHAGGTASGHS